MSIVLSSHSIGCLTVPSTGIGVSSFVLSLLKSHECHSSAQMPPKGGSHDFRVFIITTFLAALCIASRFISTLYRSRFLLQSSLWHSHSRRFHGRVSLYRPLFIKFWSTVTKCSFFMNLQANPNCRKILSVTVLILLPVSQTLTQSDKNETVRSSYAKLNGFQGRAKIRSSA
jgi:hypothetical protein